jgi:hypothetical protein
MSAADDIERLREEYQVAHQVVTAQAGAAGARSALTGANRPSKAVDGSDDAAERGLTSEEGTVGGTIWMLAHEAPAIGLQADPDTRAG